MEENDIVGQKSFPLDDNGKPVTHIDGLAYYPNFLGQLQQEELLEMIYSNPWQNIIARRQQFYGQVYYHTSYKDKDLQPSEPTQKQQPRQQRQPQQKHNHGLDINAVMPWLELCRPFFPGMELPSQVLVNEYRNNLGIASHFEDVHAFGPIILTISLVSPIYMTLKRPTEKTNGCSSYTDICKILLEPGSLLVMERDARYEYRHGISKYKRFTIPPPSHHPTTTTTTAAAEAGETSTSSPRVIHRDDAYRRVSLTIRHILDTRRHVPKEDDERDTIKLTY